MPNFVCTLFKIFLPLHAFFCIVQAGNSVRAEKRKIFPLHFSFQHMEAKRKSKGEKLNFSYVGRSGSDCDSDGVEDNVRLA